MKSIKAVATNFRAEAVSLRSLLTINKTMKQSAGTPNKVTREARTPMCKINPGSTGQEALIRFHANHYAMPY